MKGFQLKFTEEVETAILGSVLYALSDLHRFSLLAAGQWLDRQVGRVVVSRVHKAKEFGTVELLEVEPSGEVVNRRTIGTWEQA